MDYPNRASSVYSDDSKKPTYLDYRSSLEPTSRPTSSQRTPEEAYAAPAFPKRNPPPASMTSVSSSRPSFMNYQNGTHAQPLPIQGTRESTPITPSSSNRPASNLILLFFAAEVEPSAAGYLETLLKRQNYSGIAIIGCKEHEVGLKHFKMDVYALIGKLGREMSVTTHTSTSRREEHVAVAVSEAAKAKPSVAAVLCGLTYDTPMAGSTDILSLGQDDLRQVWQSSVGWVQTIAKLTLPKLASSKDNTSSRHAMFLTFAPEQQTSLASVHKSACDTLMEQLSSSYSTQILVVGHAKAYLVPDPDSSRTNGASLGPTGASPGDDQVFTPGESPTKLWNMWALQNDLGG